jgi:hypothetical protein
MKPRHNSAEMNNKQSRIVEGRYMIFPVETPNSKPLFIRDSLTGVHTTSNRKVIGITNQTNDHFVLRNRTMKTEP